MLINSRDYFCISVVVKRLQTLIVEMNLKFGIFIIFLT